MIPPAVTTPTWKWLRRRLLSFGTQRWSQPWRTLEASCGRRWRVFFWVTGGWFYIQKKNKRLDTPKGDGFFEKVDLFKIWPFLVSILDFWGVIQKSRPSKQQKMMLESCCLGWGKQMGFSNLSPFINLLWCTTRSLSFAADWRVNDMGQVAVSGCQHFRQFHLTNYISN